MSDLNDLTKPDLQSDYANGDVPDTLLGHIKRLWTGDYTGMLNLVPNMLRWAITGNTTLSARLYRRNAAGADVEVTVLPGVSIGGNAATATAADSAPASDVYTWAKQSIKPSYLFSEIGDKPTTVAGYGITDAGGLGAGQAWQSVVRTSGITYTNSTGRPIVLNVLVYASSIGRAAAVVCTINGTNVVSIARSNVATSTLDGCCGSIVIPISATYAIGGSGFSFLFCYELR